MSQDLSALIAGLLTYRKSGNDLSSEISRIRSAIKKVIDDNTILGKLAALVGSIQEVIPDEQQRYQVAIKALCATSKLSRPEIAASLRKQLEELKILEKHMVSVLPGGAEERQSRQARSQELRSEIARLREKIAQLEKEEQEVAGSMTRPGNESAVIEKAVREVFADLGAEITAVVRKLEMPSTESAAQRPVPVIEIEAEAAVQKQPSVQKNSTPQRAPLTDSIYPDPAPAAALTQNRDNGKQRPTSPQPPTSVLKKKCPMCNGQMNYYSAYGKWQCYACGFEYIKNEVPANNPVAAQAKTEEKRDTNALFAIPVTEPLFDHSKTVASPGYWEAPKKNSIFSKKPTMAKTCPSCGQRMHSFGSGKGWECSFCGYERRI